MATITKKTSKSFEVQWYVNGVENKTADCAGKQADNRQPSLMRKDIIFQIRKRDGF